MKFNKRLLWLIIPLIIFSLVYINSSSVSTVLLAIKGAITDGNLVKFSGINGVGEDAGVSSSNVKYGKFDATSAPTVNNDVDEGYTVGSRWLDITNDKEYVCSDNSDGAAVWTETTGEAGVSVFTGLTDTPANYTGQAGKYAKVNVGEDALEFGTPAGAGTVTTSGTPVANDIPRFTDETVIEGLSYAELKVALDLEIGTDLQAYDAGLLSLAGLTYVSDSFIKVTATDTYAIRTIAEMKTDLGFMTDLVDDVTPQLGEQLQAGAHSINFTEQVLTPGTAVAWNLGNSNKATLIPAQNFTITITAPSGALNAQLIVTQDGTGSRVMDEIVTQTDTAIATTDVHADTEIIDLVVDIPTGARIRFKTSVADLPEPLVVDTIYWAIRTSENHIKVSTTKANAIAGTAIDITDQGTGTHTVQQLVKWTGGTLGVLSTAAGSEDILSLTYKTGDKQWYAQLANDFY